MKKVLAALALTLAASTANAEVLTYDCSLHRMEQGWIAERVILSVDAENKRARAYDAYIHEYDGQQPKDVKFKETRKGAYRLTWKMNIPASNGGLIYVSYSAKLDPEKQRLDLTASFPQVNALNRPSGYGGCSVNSTGSLYAS
ncbi:hypothetical protein RUE5091_00908 [Ruegeria denitrificans]|uniref:Uncharacterized protein n=1 Tax=Ruegeria denitrificans TaxID=1715692 RepID=A0A0P1I4I2_9RHOB|nr:hypothetical protein [Ruegeria denitrificans]CUJ89657.1 hypothetical protein RUE5091_00908 [Ruegeria denitrificans]